MPGPFLWDLQVRLCGWNQQKQLTLSMQGHSNVRLVGASFASTVPTSFSTSIPNDSTASSSTFSFIFFTTNSVAWD
jgi:hypothetical protein